jgi:hypothetical protein
MNSLIRLLIADLQKEDFDLEGEIESFAEHVGWSNVLQETMHVLGCPSKQSHWYQAASIVYWAVLDGKELPFPRKELLAHLYYCLEVYPDLGQNDDLLSGSNLVWSIATRLLTISYESSWDHLSDDDITTRISSIRAANA